jgi:hypothetical protein
MTQRAALAANIQNLRTSQQSHEAGVQRRCGCGNRTHGVECDSCTAKKKVLQRKALQGQGPARIPPGIDAVLSAPGRPLDVATRGFMEGRFERDFSQVRVHTDVSAGHSAMALGASAYTSGSDIVFAPGRYAPGSERGHRLLAHELTHVVQQSQWSGTDARLLGDPADAAEREADANGERLLRGEPMRVRETPTALIHGDMSDGEKALLGVGIGAGVAGLGLLAAWAAGAFDRRKQGQAQQQASPECQRHADKIKQHPVYLGLESGPKALADEIISEALMRANCMYYLKKLKLLLDTPEAPAGDVETSNRAAVDAAVAKEHTERLKPDILGGLGKQEALANDPARRWTRRTGLNGKKYLVDATDSKNIVVRIRIHLVASGARTTDADVAKETFLEDAVERVAQDRGYTVDVVFVDVDGEDVFTVGSDLTQWATAGNLVGGARTLAHEIHHLLGLPDRYDYIESHAGNASMKIPARLQWFREQMRRAADPAGNLSLMGRGEDLLEKDICTVAGLDVATCMAERAAP